jgi:hypothetical protein
VSIAAAQVKQTGLVLGFGSACVVILLSVAIASQKYDSVGRLLNCRSGSTLTWVDMDFFFSEVHWTPADSTLPAQHRHTTFGGMVSMILIVTIVFVSIQLGTSNLSPTYSSSVSIEPPQWQPHGFYSLTVTIFGSGLQSCVGSGNSDISIQWVPSHWTGSLPITQLSYDPSDGSCLVSWTCNPCQLVTVNTSPLRIIVSSNSFSTHAQYLLKTPPFTVSSTDSGSESQGPFSVSGYITSGDFTTPTAFQGDASVVTLLLTVFNVSLGSQQRIAFQPVVTNTERGKIITPQTFNLSTQTGFEYRFDLIANSFTLVNIGQTGNVFNLIVLLLSLAGSIISGFSILLPELEKRLKIVTIWGAPAMEGDVGRSWSDKISEIDVRLGSMAAKAKQFDELETRFNQMSESIQSNFQSIQKNFPTVSFDFASFATSSNVQNSEVASTGRRRSVVLPSLSAALVGYYDGMAASSAIFEKNLKTPMIELTDVSVPVSKTDNSGSAQNSFDNSSVSTSFSTTSLNQTHSAKPQVPAHASTSQSNRQFTKAPPAPSTRIGNLKPANVSASVSASSVSATLSESFVDKPVDVVAADNLTAGQTDVNLNVESSLIRVSQVLESNDDSISLSVSSLPPPQPEVQPPPTSVIASESITISITSESLAPAVQNDSSLSIKPSPVSQVRVLESIEDNSTDAQTGVSTQSLPPPPLSRLLSSRPPPASTSFSASESVHSLASTITAAEALAPLVQNNVSTSQSSDESVPASTQPPPPLSRLLSTRSPPPPPTSVSVSDRVQEPVSASDEIASVPPAQAPPPLSRILSSRPPPPKSIRISAAADSPNI